MVSVRRPLIALALAAGLALLAVTAAGAGGATTSVVGGEPAARGEYPFMTALVDDRAPNAYQGLFCGGSLIGPRRVLTAAHCVQGSDVAKLDLQVGAYRLRAGDGVRLPAARFAVDPRWRYASTHYDSAIVKLPRAVKIPTVQVVGPGQGSLWDADSPVKAIGFGVLHASKHYRPGRLFEVDLHISADRRCEQAYGASYHYASMLCIRDRGKDTCFGDSGGPVLADSGGTWVEVGIVSTGEGCAAPKFPGIYAQVASMHDFILDRTPVWAAKPKGGPRVRGNPAVGNSLTCDPGRWIGKKIHFLYQWGVLNFSGGNPFDRVFSETGKQLRLTGRYEGDRVACRVIAVNPGGRAGKLSRFAGPVAG